MTWNFGYMDKLASGITVSISSKEYHEHLNPWELGCARTWWAGIEWVGGWKGVPREIQQIDHEVSPDYHIKAIAADILMVLLNIIHIPL